MGEREFYSRQIRILFWNVLIERFESLYNVLRKIRNRTMLLNFSLPKTIKVYRFC